MWAGQSLQLRPGRQGSYTIPDRSPFNALGDFRVELRLSGFSGCTQNYSNVWRFGSLQLRCFLAGSTDLDAVDLQASRNVVIPMSGRTDVTLRIQRRTADGLVEVEIWNTATGSNYQRVTSAAGTFAAVSGAGQHPVGGAATSLDIAWVQWFSTLVPTGSAPPRIGGTSGLLARWNLDGDTQDAGGQRLDVSFSGASYSTTATYPPAAAPFPRTALVASLPSVLVARAGSTVEFDGSRSFVSSDTSASVTYSWQQMAGPTKLTWTDRDTALPTATGLAFGEYTIRLTVTDSSGQFSSADLTFGVVATDSRDVVLPGDEKVNTVMGPLLRWGVSPWPYLDDRHMALADHFGSKLSDASRADDWNAALAGTITVTQNSAAVTGEGTSFQTDFCNGGATPTGVEFVVWYPVGDGTFGRRSYGVAQCNSATSLTLSSPYGATATTAGLNYAKLSCPGCWYGGSNNFNYYDNVLAFYSLYYRTGLTRHLNYARTLADRWWTNPYIDQGRVTWFGKDFASHLPAPRVLGMTGLIWRAYEGGLSDMWPGIRKILEVQSPNRTDIWDMREEGYQTAFVALGALLDPDAPSADKWRTATLNAVSNLWVPNQDALKGWRGRTYGWESANTNPVSYARMTNGSTRVIGINTGSYWPGSMAAVGLPGLWLQLQGETEAYWVTEITSTALTLATPYTGTSGDKVFQLNSLVGTGTQPFMMGVIGTALAYSYAATGDARAKQMVIDVANWESAYGYRSATRGLYGGRVFPGCEPPADVANNCVNGPSSDPAQKSWDRYLNGEVIGAVARAYALSLSDEIKTLGDNLAGAAFGKLGGPSTDAYYAKELDETILYDKAKNFGFFFGFGGAQIVSASRLGPRAGSDSQTVVLAYPSSPVPATGRVLLDLTSPRSGKLERVVCTSPPCVFTRDPAQQLQLFRFSYDNNGRGSQSITQPLRMN